jgi:CHAT domain-containing protein
MEIALRDQHLQALQARLLDSSTISCKTRDCLVQALASQTLELVYFYCHGKTEQLPGSNATTTYLEIGDDDRITPEDIIAWKVSDWPADHWRNTSPLVFINGCHTADLTPEALVNFVDTFALADASGVIGTEITLHQRVANEAALIFYQHFRNNTAAEAIRQMRAEFLAKGNMLGLAYTLYASGDLRLVL